MAAEKAGDIDDWAAAQDAADYSEARLHDVIQRFRAAAPEASGDDEASVRALSEAPDELVSLSDSLAAAARDTTGLQVEDVDICARAIEVAARLLTGALACASRHGYRGLAAPGTDSARPTPRQHVDGDQARSAFRGVSAFLAAAVSAEAAGPRERAAVVRALPLVWQAVMAAFDGDVAVGIDSRGAAGAATMLGALQALAAVLSVAVLDASGTAAVLRVWDSRAASNLSGVMQGLLEAEGDGAPSAHLASAAACWTNILTLLASLGLPMAGVDAQAAAAAVVRDEPECACSATCTSMTAAKRAARDSWDASLAQQLAASGAIVRAAATLVVRGVHVAATGLLVLLAAAVRILPAGPETDDDAAVPLLAADLDDELVAGLTNILAKSAAGSAVNRSLLTALSDTGTDDTLAQLSVTLEHVKLSGGATDVGTADTLAALAAAASPAVIDAGTAAFIIGVVSATLPRLCLATDVTRRPAVTSLVRVAGAAARAHPDVAWDAEGALRSALCVAEGSAHGRVCARLRCSIADVWNVAGEDAAGRYGRSGSPVESALEVAVRVAVGAHPSWGSKAVHAHLSATEAFAGVGAKRVKKILAKHRREVNASARSAVYASWDQ